MLSRLASRAPVQTQALVSRPFLVAVQNASTDPAASSKDPHKDLPEIEDPLEKVEPRWPLKVEGPERDLVNFPRPVLREHPGAVRLGFIPEEWFDFFYKKTGVTGPYMFLFGTWTYLLSKEIYVLEHNFYNGISLLIIIIALHKLAGPKLAAWTDKEIDKWIEDTRAYELSLKQDLFDGIKENENSIWKLEGYKEIMDARREIIAAALEASYREWMHNAYQEAKKRLDYQVELATVERRIAQKNMASWITDSVLKAITPAQEQESLKKCIADLKSLSVAA